jgi:hypothetical protein
VKSAVIVAALAESSGECIRYFGAAIEMAKIGTSDIANMISRVFND